MSIRNNTLYITKNGTDVETKLYPEPYGKYCDLPNPLECIFNQIMGVLSVFVLIGVIYLLIYHINEKLKLKESFFKSKKTWMIMSMLCYTIYLVLEFNFELE